MKVYISTGYNHVAIRKIPQFAVKNKPFVLRTDNVLRENAVDRFLREEVGIIGLGVYGSLSYEVDKEKLKKIASLLRVDIRTKDIRETLGGYIRGELSLDETYDRYLPLIIANKLVET